MMSGLGDGLVEMFCWIWRKIVAFKDWMGEKILGTQQAAPGIAAKDGAPALTFCYYADLAWQRLTNG
jgi:hypothetical protein